jgi:hypothetical protein
MKKLSNIVLILTLGLSIAVFGCGESEDQAKDPSDTTGSTDTTTDGGDTTGTDNSGTDTTDGTDTGSEDITASCTQVCEYLISCLGQLTCDPALGEFDAAACVQDCVTRGEMNQASAANYVTQSCDDVNRSQCNADPDQFANCDCPEANQGNCPEGQFCTIPLTDSSGNTLYACGDEAGAAPVDAPTCSQEAPACEDATQQCILFNAEGTEGYCLALCEQ